MKPFLPVRSHPYRSAHRCLFPLMFMITALFVGAPVYAQDKTSEIDEIFAWVTPEMPGCAIAVSQKGEVVVNRAYGLAHLETETPIGPNTMFDIGSVQKQFVAAAVLLLVEDGHLSLSDDIRSHIPELPDYGHTITLDHLLTHTSGVRDWVSLSNFSSESEDALTMILRQRGLNFAPGEEWSYSNSNYVLLKEIVARTSGMSFAAFTRTRLFEVLGMEHTLYAPDIQAAKNGAHAYEKEDDVWRPAMMLGNERGGGAILSTVSDLLLWNEALSSNRLGAFVSRKLQEPARLNNGRQLSYARGLFVDTTPFGKVVWHTGSARAYKALLSRIPEHGLSIALLCNAGETGERNMARRRIADVFLPEPAAQEPDADEPAANANVEDIDVSGKAGLFFSEPTGEPLRLVVQEGRLRVDRGPVLVAVDKDRFRPTQGRLSFMSEDEFELHFLSPGQFVLTSMEGETTRYRRAQPYTPTAAELQDFIGRYESDDLRAVLEVASGDDGPTIRLNDSRPFAFAPVDRDVFQLGPMTTRFLRDEDDKVVALDYSNPVLRNVTFTRLSDR